MLLARSRPRPRARRPSRSIVVDDGSRDATPAVLEAARDRGRLDLQVLQQERSRGPAAARNRGWRAARAAAIVFTDDDCEPVAGWLECCWRRPPAARHGRAGQGPPEPGRGHAARRVHPLARGHRPEPALPDRNILYPRPSSRRSTASTRTTARRPARTRISVGGRAAPASSPSSRPRALVYHAVHQRGPLNSLRDASRATDCVKAYRDHPQLREHLANGIFFHPSHPLLAQAALAAALIPATPLSALFALPYAAHLVRRCRWSKTPVYTAPFLAARDARGDRSHAARRTAPPRRRPLSPATRVAGGRATLAASPPSTPHADEHRMATPIMVWPSLDPNVLSTHEASVSSWTEPSTSRAGGSYASPSCG